ITYSAGHGGLIGDHGNWQTCPVQRGDRIDRPIDEPDPLNRADISAVHDDRATPVEKYPRPPPQAAHVLPILSSSLRLSGCRRCARARTAGRVERATAVLAVRR